MPDSVFTAQELSRLPTRARDATFQPALRRLRREVDAFYAMQLSVPEKPGGYYHDYTCPDHGVELQFDPHQPTRHCCPVDQARFTGEKYDAAWRWFANHHLAEGALRLAVLWRAEGDEHHREAVRQILLAYAARYESYAACDRPGANPGVATYTTLDESVWSIPLAWAFSLIAETLSAADVSTVVTKLFVPAAEHLQRRRYRGIHNFTCWHNAAIANLGRIAGRPDLVEFALEGALGQRDQLTQGMLGDGLWFEGSMSYHFYSVWALLMSALVFRHDRATEITSHPALRRSLQAPLACAYPDGTLPATNDCWYATGILGPCCHGVPPAPEFYELGFTLFGDDAFAETLHRAYRPAVRDGLYALLFGAGTLPEPDATPRRGVLLPDSGLAILRPTPEFDLMLKFGPHGGHHGHPDKLAITGSDQGWRFSPDLGTPGYGVASLETWYRQTLSHNTVLIDGESQPPAQGRLDHFSSGSAAASVEWPGVKLRRAVHARPGYFIDVFEVDCTEPRTIDWVYHNAGILTDLADSRPVSSLAGGIAFQHLADVREITAAAAQKLRWRDGAMGLDLWMPSTDEAIFTGRSPGNPPTTSLCFVLRRRSATQAVFLAVAHPYRDRPDITDVEFRSTGALVVHVGKRQDHWTAAQLAARAG